MDREQALVRLRELMPELPEHVSAEAVLVIAVTIDPVAVAEVVGVPRAPLGVRALAAVELRVP